MGRISPAMADGTKFVRALLQHLPDLFRNDGAGKRCIGGGEAVREGNDIGANAVVIGAAHSAEAAEGGDNCIGDQQYIIFLEYPLDRRPIALGRRHDAASAENGLTDKGSDGV